MALYCRQGKLIATPGQRDALAALLLEDETALSAMPGCRLYLVFVSAEEPDAVLVTEAWDSAEAHRASLQLPSVAAAIEKAMPLIAGGSGGEVTLLGGIGLN